jgi:hypothetical protein
MLSISAWARSMINWFTQAMAWDLVGSGVRGWAGLASPSLPPRSSRPSGALGGAALTGSWGCSA